MSVQGANLALGHIKRDPDLPRAERIKLYARASVHLDAADAEIPVTDARGRRRLAAAERRYVRVRTDRGDIGLLP
ncbi:MAG: hypothetical protein OXH75_15630 [Acidobacteria bacterium]|nr:hypothetical protein [Acidobacteriota bacterium]